jgi:hypothetical protein
MFVVLAVVFLASSWFAPRASYVGGPGDPEAHMWYLRWIPYALTHGHNPLVSTYVGYPAGFNAMWNNSDGVPLLPVLLWPVTSLFGVFVSYNVMATLALALSAWTAYLVCRRFVSSSVAAFVGALPFGFGSYMAAQLLGHAALAFLPFVPLLFLALREVVVGRRLPAWMAGALLGIVTAAQLMIAEELVATAAVISLMAVVALALLYPNQVSERLPRILRAGAVAVLVFIVLAAGPIYVQFFGPQTIKGMVRPPDTYVTDLLNFVLPGPVQLIRFAAVDPVVARFTGNASEWNGYLGVGFIGILLYTVIRYRQRRAVLWTAAIALVVAVFSLGPHIHVGGEISRIPGLWRVGHVPLLVHILPSRMMLFFYLFAGILLAVFVEGIIHSHRRVAKVAGTASVLLALVLLLPKWPYPEGGTALPSFFTSDLVRKEVAQGEVALLAPYAGAVNYEPMVWQAAADFRFRMPEGNYLGPDASGHAIVGPVPTAMSDTMISIAAGGAAPNLDTPARATLVDYLASRHIAIIIVGPMAHDDTMVAFFTDLLGRAPAQEGGVALWRGPFP